jgi:acylphosphatase
LARWRTSPPAGFFWLGEAIMTDPLRCMALRIEGRVQGVGYRAWLAETARAHGLEGWARNVRDGSVEAVLAGPPTSVDAVIERCHRGQALARVDRVAATPAERPTSAGFHVLPTA